MWHARKNKPTRFECLSVKDATLALRDMGGEKLAHWLSVLIATTRHMQRDVHRVTRLGSKGPTCFRSHPQANTADAIGSRFARLSFTSLTAKSCDAAALADIFPGRRTARDQR